MAKKKKFNVEVRRYYFIVDHIEVESTSAEKARELAEEISNKKDSNGEYTAEQLGLEEVVTEIM
jgi:hypothetical protein